jgi:DNA polymerase-1
MNHLAFTEKSTYQTALLIKSSALTPSIKDYYAIDWDDTICLSLDYKDKTNATNIKADLVNILKTCKFLGVKKLFVCDTAYFKVLTKKSKAEPYYGSVITTSDFDVIVAPNYQALFYNPKLQGKIDLAVQALTTSKVLGEGIIHSETYPEGEAILEWLQKLYEYPKLTCDVETNSLAVASANLLTISFAWSKHEGIAFVVTPEVKRWLVNWFPQYQGKLIFHGGTYDVSVLIQQLFMKDLLDYEGLLTGLQVFKEIDDTKIIAYLATNSTEGNELSLKKLALEFAGNYGILDEDTPFTCIPIADGLRYNLVDALATWYVYDKYFPKMEADNQLNIYKEIMVPSLNSIVHMQLVGFPMDMGQIQQTNKILSKIQRKYLQYLQHNKIVKDFEWTLQKKAFIEKNAALKRKVIPIEQFKTQLNTNSGPQVAQLLYGHLGLPIINTTDSGAPSTDGDTLESLYNHVIQEYGLTDEDL